MLKAIFRLAAIAAGLTAIRRRVSKRTLKGSGQLTTESRDVSNFDSIALAGKGKVVAEVSGTESLTIEADDNLIDEIESKVVNGQLKLGPRDGVRLMPTAPIVYRVAAQSLNAVKSAGRGSIDVTGLDTDSFKASLAGSGDVRASGRASSQKISIAGTGKYSAADLESSVASVSIAGSGSVVVKVAEELSISIAGSGDVEYIGSPKVTPKIAGSGNIRQR